MTWYPRLVLVCTLGLACARRSPTLTTTPSPGEEDASREDASAAVDAAPTVAGDASTEDARSRTDAGGEPCTRAALQPGRCAQSPGPLRGSALEAWFIERGTKVPRRLSDDGVDGCEEQRTGPSATPMLVCVTHDPEVVDPSLGGSSPVQLVKVLNVFTLEDGRAKERFTIPFGVASSEWGELLFQTRYALAEDALAITVDPDECRQAPERLAAYWAAKKEEVRSSGVPQEGRQQLIRTMDRERAKGAARIAVVCRTAHSFPLRRPADSSH